MKTIEQEVKESIENIRAKIVADYTFLMEFLPKQDIADESIGTIGTNGIDLRYNPRFLYSRTKQDQMFFYLHEVVHSFLGHPIRIRPEHDHDIAQLAADYVTNDTLDDAKFILPRDASIDFRFRGMSYEEVYDLMKKQQDKNPNNFQKHDDKRKGTVQPQPKEAKGDGDPHEKPSDDPHENNNSDPEKELQKQLQAHEQRQLAAIQTAELMGNVSLDLQRRFNSLKERKTNWREALPTELDNILGMDDYTYSVPNYNIDDDTFIYPGMVGATVKPIALIVDTSCSVTIQKLEEMASEVTSIVDQNEPEKVIVLGVDAEVKSIQEFDQEETDIGSKIRLKGGGGTDFRPGVVYLNNNYEDLGLVVYLTDGHCNRFPPEPDYPFIWLIFGTNKSFKPPFGRIIHMD